MDHNFYLLPFDECLIVKTEPYEYRFFRWLLGKIYCHSNGHHLLKTNICRDMKQYLSTFRRLGDSNKELDSR